MVPPYKDVVLFNVWKTFEPGVGTGENAHEIFIIVVTYYG